MGHTGSIEKAGWPDWDENALVEDEKLIVVQVNGKVRGKLMLPADADEETLKERAMADANVARFMEGKTVRKIISVPGKLLNIVAS